MSESVIHTSTAVTLLGAGTVSRKAIVATLGLAPILVAADGGANVAVRAGHVPDAVIGDLDSLGARARAAIPAERLFRIAEQATTDFEKCLTRIDAPFILGLGLSGPRADHTLAVWNALCRHPSRRCLVLTSADVVFLAPPHLTLDLRRGTRLSLFPMAPVSGKGQGLRWPIDGLNMAPDGQIGTSNAAEGVVEMEFPAPRMLVIVPRAALTSVLAGLAQAPGWSRGAAQAGPAASRGE